MKTILIELVGLISFFIISVTSFAGINETLAQCEKVYGKGVDVSKGDSELKAGNKCFKFKYNNMDVSIRFDNKGLAYSIFHRKVHKVRLPITEQDQKGVAAYIKDVIATGITPVECASLLKLNRDCEWIVRREKEDVCEYITNDGSNLEAVYYKLVPSKKLFSGGGVDGVGGVLIGTLCIMRDRQVNQATASQSNDGAASAERGRPVSSTNFDTKSMSLIDSGKSNKSDLGKSSKAGSDYKLLVGTWTTGGTPTEERTFEFKNNKIVICSYGFRTTDGGSGKHSDELKATVKKDKIIIEWNQQVRFGRGIKYWWEVSIPFDPDKPSITSYHTENGSSGHTTYQLYKKTKESKDKE